MLGGVGLMRKSVKRALGAGIIGGAAYAAWRAWSARVPAPAPGGIEWSAAPFPFPPVPHASSTATSASKPKATVETPKPAKPKSVKPETVAKKTSGAPTAAWKKPNADGSCPKSHPVKAKMASGIFHVPGGANYARTKPDRCYVDAAAAQADGLRPAKA
jgi:hypothetical protein